MHGVLQWWSGCWREDAVDIGPERAIDDRPAESDAAADWRRSVLHEIAVADTCFFEILLSSRRP